MLTSKQMRFIEEYLIDLNASQAAFRAGYSKKTAPFIGAENLKKPQIQAAIATEMAARAQRTRITADAVLEELRILDFSDVTHYSINDQGDVVLTACAPRGAMRAISSLRKKVFHTDMGITYDTEIKFWSKPAALEMTGKHLGLFTDKVEISGKVQVVRLPDKAATVEEWMAAHPPPAEHPDA
jgi:phage terminase small subunit